MDSFWMMPSTRYYNNLNVAPYYYSIVAAVGPSAIYRGVMNSKTSFNTTDV
jgi:hypothetical protein